jgi:uncharacterized protein
MQPSQAALCAERCLQELDYKMKNFFQDIKLRNFAVLCVGEGRGEVWSEGFEFLKKSGQVFFSCAMQPSQAAMCAERCLQELDFKTKNVFQDIKLRKFAMFCVEDCADVFFLFLNSPHLFM